MALQNSESITRDNLFSAANQVLPVVSMKVTVASGEGKLARGTVLAASNSAPDSGNLKILGKSVTVGETTTVYGAPVCVLAEDIDATSAAVDCVGLCTGEFNAAKLIVATGAQLSSYVYALSRAGIFAK